MGFKRGEHPVRLAQIRVTEITREPLNAITPADVQREGFDLTPAQFVEFFCAGRNIAPAQVITRIAFEYISVQP